MSLQAEWQYLMWTVPLIGEYMGSVEEALAKRFMQKLLGMESISGSMRNILVLGANMAGLVISNPIEVSYKSHRKSLACIKLLVESLITVESLYTS